MLRFITALVLLVAFAMQTFYRAVIQLDYYARSDAYAKVCKNKARPQMHCNGKCQVMKKIKSEQEKDQENPGRKAENKAEALSLHHCNPLPGFSPSFDVFLEYPFSAPPPTVDRSYAVFHPPAFL